MPALFLRYARRFVYEILVDDLDAAILEWVQRDNRVTAERMGSEVGLSAAAVQRRLKRMREQKIIQADVSVVDPRRVGRGVTVVAEVTLVSDQSDVQQQFKERMRRASEVQQCYYVTGDADFIVIFCVADMAEYEALAQQLLSSNEHVRKFRTHVALERVKIGLHVRPRLGTQG